ncbi:MAG: hypothetical protein ACR2O3_05895 [Rhizobiaceae bacterium]
MSVVKRSIATIDPSADSRVTGNRRNNPGVHKLIRRIIVITGILFCVVPLANAGEADVVGVDVSGSGKNYRFSVTVEHADSGWDHYADAWEVVGEDGTVYGKRILAHPHVDEQPFTRSGSATIPDGINQVIVRAHDSVHGYGGKELKVDLPGR